MFNQSSYSYTDLLEALAQPCCPVCWLSQRAVAQYIRSLFYEHVNDISLREGIRASLGYCQEHTWALRDASLGNALGISIIYHDILTNILRRLPAGGTGSMDDRPARGGFLRRFASDLQRRAQSFREALMPQAACPACSVRHESAELALGGFARGLKTEQIAQPFPSAHGLCLPHLAQFIPLIDEPRLLDLVLETTRKQLSTLETELAEYIRKNDYRFNKEPWGSEEDAWRRVIGRAAGEKLS